MGLFQRSCSALLGRHLACCWLLFLCGVANGLEVTPKNPVPVYTLVRVTLDQAERSWVLRQDFTAVDVEQTKTGFCFTGPPGRYVVLAMTADGQSQAIVEIGGSGPTPNPPGPTPPTPGPERFGLVTVAADAKIKIPLEGRPFIPAIASNFAGAASAIAAGGIRDIPTAVKTVQDANKATLGSSIATWHPWGKDVGFALDALVNSGRIQTVQDYGQALSEVSQGLTQGLFQ